MMDREGKIVNDPDLRPAANEIDTVQAVDLLDAYLERIEAGNLPQLIPQHSALDGIEVGEELVTIVGAPPGQGKTALAMQIMFDALELSRDLTTVVANAETSFSGLLRRELQRITRIPAASIRFGNLTDDERQMIREASLTLRDRLSRVQVLDEHCDLFGLSSLQGKPPGLVIVDYLQKFAPGDKDARQGVNVVMSTLRQLAKTGWAVLCLSATKRDKNGKHSSDELDLSSFRESGEVEYNADSAYVLKDNGSLEGKGYLRHVTLVHVKNRHGEKVDRELRFHMPKMEFTRFEPETLNEFGELIEVPLMPWEAEASR